jgi:hypothetical protein
MSIYQMGDNEMILLGRQIIERALTTDRIRSRLEPYGYDEGGIAVGESLLRTFQEIVALRVTKEARNAALKEAFEDGWDAFHRMTYMPHLMIARRALTRTSARIAAGVDENVADNFDDYYRQVTRFYGALLNDPEVNGPMTTRGIGEERARAALEDIEELLLITQDRNTLRSLRQQATRRRNDDRRALAEWLSTLRIVSRYALREEPELGEMLGYLVRS